jgi:molybdate transport system substrate-binding protein
MISRRLFAAALALAAFVPAAPAFADDVLVFAAASLKNALDDVTTRYLNETGRSVTVSYASSSALAWQIEAGAPADIFLSADLDWMDYLAEHDLIAPDTRRSLLGNAIVLIVPADSESAVTIAPGFDLGALLGTDGRLAMADVEAGPAGRYAKAALESLGVWDAVADRIVQAENVRAALAFVARGEVPAGIVYTTDAVAEPTVKAIGAFPADSHPPIVYPVALTTASTNADAPAFLEYLKSDAARPAYEAQGFTVLSPGS